MDNGGFGRTLHGAGTVCLAVALAVVWGCEKGDEVLHVLLEPCKGGEVIVCPPLLVAIDAVPNMEGALARPLQQPLGKEHGGERQAAILNARRVVPPLRRWSIIGGWQCSTPAAQMACSAMLSDWNVHAMTEVLPPQIEGIN